MKALAFSLLALLSATMSRTRLMRLLFRQIQALDGYELTEPNARGCIPGILEAAGFADVEEPLALATPTGSISLYRARRLD